MTTQITLTEAEGRVLESLSRQQGVTQEELLHAAIEQFLAGHQTQTRKRTFGSARGLIKMAPDFDEPLDDFKEHVE